MDVGSDTIRFFDHMQSSYYSFNVRVLAVGRRQNPPDDYVIPTEKKGKHKADREDRTVDLHLMKVPLLMQ